MFRITSLLKYQPQTWYHPSMDAQTIADEQTRKPIYTYEAPVNHRGMLVIPQELRKRMKIQAQDRIVFQVYDDAIEVQAARPMTLEEACGAVPALDPPKSWHQIREEMREERGQKYIGQQNQP